MGKIYFKLNGKQANSPVGINRDLSLGNAKNWDQLLQFQGFFYLDNQNHEFKT